MKKAYDFVRSMKFGIILLLIVAAFSVAGSLIPQTFDEYWYLENYPEFGELILTLGLHRMFAQWYFIIICVLLGLSLAAATVSRAMALRKIMPKSIQVPETGYRPDELSDEKVTRLRTYLQKRRYREINTGEATVYHKNRAGYFGSVFVHLSLLLILVFGGAVLALADIEDVLLFPGETAVLSDGSTMHLFSFTRESPTGREESISVIEVITPDGRSSGVREIRVNVPLRFNSYVFYQFHHLYAASITATDIVTQGSDTFYLVERAFLSADGRTGIWFETVFQSFRVDEDTGRIIPLIYNAPIFPNPLYYFMVVTEDVQRYNFAIPGSHMHVGNIRFEFNDLILYPGIRVSYSPQPFPALLLAASGLLMIGLYLAFYHSPSVVILKGNRYKITAIPSSGIDLDIIAMLYEDEEVPKDIQTNDEDEDTPEVQEGDREVDI